MTPRHPSFEPQRMDVHLQTLGKAQHRDQTDASAPELRATDRIPELEIEPSLV